MGYNQGHNQKIGNLGQKIAVKFLRSKGYKILKENVYFRSGEIDILAEKNNILSFIEVKTRTNLAFGYPEEGVTDRKRAHLESAIDAYVLKYDIQQEYVLEIISILLDLKAKKAHIYHFY